MPRISYRAEPTPAKFHVNNDDFVRAIVGPIGSGKSVACCWEIMLRAMAQAPAEDGTRYSRWVVVRNTYRELIDTTMNTWYDWFPVQMKGANFLKQDMKFTLKQKLADGTKLDLEVLFRALDKPDDVKKLLSLELTGGWINECREIPRAVFDMLLGRLGRYPSKRRGGPTWYGCILDTNPPDEDHWFYKLFEEENPEGYCIYHQPSGLSKEAENKSHLPPRYYHNMMPGKDQEWINVYVHGRYGFVRDGKPIYPEYQDDVHSTLDPIVLPDINFDIPIYVGIDFGLTPAATFGFLSPTGQWCIFDELVSEDMGALSFGKLLGQKLRTEFRHYKLEIWGDPAGDTRAQTDEKTPFEILRSLGINAWPAKASSDNVNDFSLRRESVAAALLRLSMDGKPGLIIGPKARQLRKAMAGGYKFRRMKVAGDERFQDKPDKNVYSHVAESLQYMFIGAGEDYGLIGFNPNSKPLEYDDRGYI